MMIGDGLNDGVIHLRCLRREDVGDHYLDWMRDPEVNRYLEVRHDPPRGISDLVRYVETINDSPDTILFGIFLSGGPHIGNIKLGPVNATNRRAEIGLLIGDRRHWGKGYATRAIRLASDFAFTSLNLVRLTAGVHEPNQGSFRAFLKAGFVHEGTSQNYWQSGGSSVNQLWLGRTNIPREVALPSANFGEVRSMVLIGGGNLLRGTMMMVRSKGLLAGAILARRHAAEIVAGGRSLIEDLEAGGFPVAVADTVADVDPLRLGKEFEGALALCFGPAWVFPEQVRARFARGMLNFNGIPIPHYLGGAHYTWQILNGHRQAGCHIQRITGDIDRGDLLLSETFNLSPGASTPEDYFRENEEYARRFLEGFLEKIIARRDFSSRSFADLDCHRLYFPRLLTAENGWIDWSWPGDQIAAFCRAFGPPYRGASTTLHGARIYLQRVALTAESFHPDFHPFCSGLIVRRLDDAFFVAVRGGLLRVEQYELDAEKAIRKVRIREGDRLFTAATTIERARTYRPRISAGGDLTETA